MVTILLTFIFLSYQISCYAYCYRLSNRNSIHAATFHEKQSRYILMHSKHNNDHSNFISYYEEVTVPSLKGIYFADITPAIRDVIKRTGVKCGQVCAISRHTTTSITINELEARLVDDCRQFLLKLAPPNYPYLHNDLHLRHGPSDWPGGDEAWRAQEPINAHSHLLNMILGSSQTVPISDGELKIGKWQSVIMVELDGPRDRSIGIQVIGTA